MNLVGSKWKAVVNGKRALNGAAYSVTFFGDVEEAEPEHTLYDAVSLLADELAEKNRDMEHPVSIQITFCTPEELKK